jgi:hypothetical protein
MFENKLLRRMLGLKREDVTRSWRKLCFEEHDNLYSSLNTIGVIISGRMRWVGHVACIVWMTNAYRILVTTHEEQRPIAKHRCRGEDNININFKQIGCEGVV